MSILDVFNTDAFGLVSLTGAIKVLPVKPGRIGMMGLFTPKPLTTRTAVLERINKTLSILQTGSWGGPASQGTVDKRDVRSFAVPHTPHDDRILASDIQGVRELGQESEVQTIVGVVNDRLTTMKQRHEVTHEYRKSGAVQGTILDADGTTLFNLFTEFSITRAAEDFLFGTADESIREHCLNIKRVIERALGLASLIDHVHGLCSESFFDAFIKHADVKTAYESYQAGEFLRNDPRAGFPFGGIVWEEYSGSVGGTKFVTEGDANVFPVGVPELFLEAFAPADFVETVNTRGLPYYAKQELMKFGKGVDLHTQSNQLPLCSVPEVLVRAHSST